MLEFLNNMINNETIIKIMNNNDKSLLYDISCNKENMIKIITYLKEINVKVVNDLLINRLDLFTKNPDEIRSLFKGVNEEIMVSLINEDYTAIDALFDF